MKHDQNFRPVIPGTSNGYLQSRTAPENFESKPIVDLTEKQRSQYSVTRAIEWLANYPTHDEGTFELEVSREIGAKTGRLPSAQLGSSIFVPTDLVGRSGLSTLSNAAGLFDVQTSVVPELIELLRNQTRVFQLGAQLLSGLRNSLQFVVETTATAATWQSENGGVDNSDQDQVFSYRSMNPKMVIGNTSFSRKLLAQASIQVETMVRTDLTRSIAIALDLAAIAGATGGANPVGLLSASPAIGSVAIGANGGAATYANICALEDAVGNANADSPDMAFLSTPDQRSKLRQQFKNGTGSEPIWDGNTVLGYRAAVSKQVPSNLTKGSGSNLSAIIAGNFSELVIGEWSALEITVDPYKLKRQGMIECDVYGMFDVMVRRPAAFAAITDAA